MKKSVIFQIVEGALMVAGIIFGVCAENEMRKEANEEAKLELLEDSGKEAETAN